MLEICGSNDRFQLDEKSNSKDLQYGWLAISPPKKSQLEVPSVSSYSSYYFQTVVITEDGEAFAAGNNTEGQISWSLQKENLKKFTKFEIKTEKGLNLYPISAVCGYNFTLYIVSPNKESNKNFLVLCYEKKSDLDPLFLMITDFNPVSLFGGFSSAAAIDKEGSVIFISLSFRGTASRPFERSCLPNEDEAVSVSCCVNCIYAVGVSGRVFESRLPSPGSNKLNFKPVNSLIKVKIVEVSGTYLHCFAVSDEGKVFGCGSNEHGKLGIGRMADKVADFEEITSLSEYKIRHAYAGMNHSLFQTVDGEILACGDNRYGQLFSDEPSKDPIYLPRKTGIKKDATFCVAGSDTSAVFIGHNPSKSPNRCIQKDKILAITTRDLPSTDPLVELSVLKAENELLREENTSLRKTIKEQQEKDKKLANQSISKLNIFTQNEYKTKDIEILDSEEVRNLETIEEIGYGSGGKVFKVTKKKNYALKQMNIQNASFENLQNFIKEYEIMNMLDHPNILKTHGIFFSDETIPPSILLEYCPMNLEQTIKKMQLTKVQIVYIIYQIAEGMKYVHFRKIIHRDLKPSNILINEEGTIKICDFGISKLMTIEEQSMTKGLGTQKFMAPEIINEENYDEKVDVYSFGVLVYFIVTDGQLPQTKIKDIVEGKKAQIPTTIPLLARQLIEACWFFEPEKRPSFEVICETLEENDFDLLSLSKNECKEVTNLIKQYKIHIPAYYE